MLQVSDQLIEINGDSTSGMTHSQAVEQIRKGGNRIHLILKKGNGYVPDYDHEAGVTSPSSLFSEEAHASSPDHGPSRSSRRVDDSDHERRERRGNGRSRRRGSEERRGASDSERGWADVSAAGGSQKKGSRREQQIRSRSLPSTVRSREGGRRNEDEDGAQEERRSAGRKAKDGKERESVVIEKQHKKKTTKPEVTHRSPFSFLMPLDNDDDGSGAESARSFSEVSVSAASISFSGSLWPPEHVSPLWAPGSSTTAPGPWLVPGPHKLSQVSEGKRLSRNKGGLWS